MNRNPHEIHDESIPNHESSSAAANINVRTGNHYAMAMATTTLTQGCSIEWGEECDTDTPRKTINLHTLFQSPTPTSTSTDKSRSNSTQSSSDIQIHKSRGRIGSVTSVKEDLKLATQSSSVLSISRGKEKRVEAEVDYIFSVLAHDSSPNKEMNTVHGDAGIDMAGEGVADADDCHDDSLGTQLNHPPTIKTNSNAYMNTNTVLNEVNGYGRRLSGGGVQITGASHRKKRRQMMERKRLFHSKSRPESSSSFKQKSKMQKKENSKNPHESNREVNANTAGASSTRSNNVSSFDSLLQELDEGSTWSQDESSNDDDDDNHTSADASVHEKVTNEDENVKQIRHKRDEHDSVNIEKQNDQITIQHCKTQSISSKIPAASKDPSKDLESSNNARNNDANHNHNTEHNGDFADFDFDDDVFAALDAAVQDRQTQSGTQPHDNRASSCHGESSQNSHPRQSQPPPSTFSLERSPTLPTSNVTGTHPPPRHNHSDILSKASVLKDLSNTNEKDLLGAAGAITETVHLNKSQNSCTNASADTMTVTVGEIIDNADNDDPFGDDFDDFEAMDLDRIDQQVAQRQSATNIAPTQTQNTRMTQNMNQAQEGPEFINCTRYRICSVDEDSSNHVKYLGVKMWDSHHDDDEAESYFKHEAPGATDVNDVICGLLHLTGQWFYTKCEVGDVIHLCSLNGRYDTSPASLPLYLNSSGDDDIVMILHPDQLVTPTTVSEAVDCSRRAVLKTRYGSSGLTSKAALVGTMRHALFEKCLLHNNFTMEFAKVEASHIVRDHGDQLIGGGLLNEKQITSEVVKMLPNIRRFAATYTNFTTNNCCGKLIGEGISPDVEVMANKVHGTEEFAISSELGIKGFIDASVEVTTKSPNGIQSFMKNRSTTKSLMGIELKTGHSQTPRPAHMAQLALYTLALRTRYGSIPSKNKTLGDDLDGASYGGMLLYLNQESFNAVHVAPSINELKTLLGQRNDISSDLKRVSAPRGVSIEYDTKCEEKGEKRITVHPATPPLLPDLLHSTFSCERCYSNRECMLNAAVENQFLPGTSDSKRAHSALLQHFTGHLEKIELQYWKEWDRLLDLETSENSKEITKAWLTSSSELERSTAKTISSLVIDESTIHDESNIFSGNETSFVIKFYRCPNSSISTPLNALRFEARNRVVISTDGSSLRNSKQTTQRHIFGISRGTITDIDEQNAYVKVNHGDFLRISHLVRSKGKENDILLRLDKEDFTTGTSTLRQNLSNLFTGDIAPYSTKPKESQETLTNTEQRSHSSASSLRRSIVHLDAPKFYDVSLNHIFEDKKLTALSNDFSKLNVDQQAAVHKVITAQDYSLIQGFPGTGKTSTIVFIVRLMVAMGRRVLVTSYTHAAVDNILLKLMEYAETFGGRGSMVNTDLVRVGTKSSIHPALHKIIAPELAGEIDRRHVIDSNSLPQDVDKLKPSISSLHQVISSAKIIGVSALTVPKSPLLIGQNFDLVIVDEAGQISQPAIIGALMAADSFVLVGDHEQLPPLVQSDVAEKAGYSESMLKRLADMHPSAVAQLTLQYRMHEDISLLPNILAYNGLLKCGNEFVKSRKISLPNFPRPLKALTKPNVKGVGWLLPVLNPNKPVVFVNTDKLGTNLEGAGKGHRIKGGGGSFNEAEVLLSSHIVNGLSMCGLQPSSVGIISPYRAQVNRMEENEYIRSKQKGGLEVSTVDKYQGRDKELIILSMVRSNDLGKTGRLLEDKRRLNVAFSRAKMKIIIIGSWNTLLSGSSVLTPVLQEIMDKGWVENLPQNCLDLYKFPCD